VFLSKIVKYLKDLLRFNGDVPSSLVDKITDVENIKNSLINSKGIVYSIDKNFNITWMNIETAKKYPNAFSKKCFKEFADLDVPCPNCYCTKAMQTGEFQSSIRHLNYPTTIKGGSFWRGFSVPLFNENKKVMGALTFSEEIEDTQQHRNKLLEENLSRISDTELDDFIHKNYEIIFENLHLPICITGNNLKAIFYNQSFAKIIGYGNEDLTDKAITDLIPAINNIGTKKILWLIVSGTDEQSYAITLKNDFDVSNVNLQISPIQHRDGQINGIIWKLNVLQPQNIETDNFIINSRFNNNFGVMIIDKLGKVIHWNQFLVNNFHWEEEELIGLSNPIIGIDTILEYIDNQSSDKLELTRETKTGQKIDVKLSIFPIYNNAGEISQFVCLVENTTYEKYIKSEFKELEERYTGFIKNFEGITFKFDSEFNAVQMKGSVYQLTGFTEEEFLDGKIKFIDLIYQDDKILIDDYINKIKNHIRTEKELELRIKTKQGTIKWIHLYFQNTVDEFGNVTMIQGFLYNITRKKEVEEELKLRREEYRNLAMYLETVREEEKKRLALEIHDELGHALTAIKLELAWVLKKKFLRHDVMIEKVRKMNELIESTIRKVRTISSDLRPSVLDHFGLEAALEWQSLEFQKRYAIRCKIQLDKQSLNIDEKTSTAIFRIFQEILTNIAKHAKASRVDVVFGKNQNNIILKVRDNGKGFKFERTKKSKSLGILGMSERANAIGGKLSINSIIGVGTTVLLEVPLRN